MVASRVVGTVTVVGPPPAVVESVIDRPTDGVFSTSLPGER